MSAIRETTAKRVTRLAAKSSPYHAAVTLYAAQDDAEPSTSRRGSRRSTRVKLEDVAVEEDTPELPLLKSKKERLEVR